jgi:hypothetical protein
MSPQCIDWVTHSQCGDTTSESPKKSGVQVKVLKKVINEFNTTPQNLPPVYLISWGKERPIK